MDLSPELLLMGYAEGIFPMSYARHDDKIFFVEPDNRGIFPLEGFHIPKRLKRSIRATEWDVRVNYDFSACIRHCAETVTVDRTETWINHTIEQAYTRLHELGHAHSVEVWQDNKIVGGLYGVSLRGAFFGESMFSHITDASKVALVYLVARLKAGDFCLLDTQFVTEHLSQFGARALAKSHYKLMLQEALKCDDSDFFALSENASADTVINWALS